MEESRGRSAASPWIDTSSAARTVTILANVEWIVARLDRRGLAAIDDVPVLELAKHISVERSPAEANGDGGARHR